MKQRPAGDMLASLVAAARKDEGLLSNGSTIATVEHTNTLTQITFANGDVVRIKAWWPQGEIESLRHATVT